MASILMGTTTALLIILGCGGCFYAGYKVGYANNKTEVKEEKAKSELTEEQKRINAGITNILNYSNRHGGGKK